MSSVSRLATRVWSLAPPFVRRAVRGRARMAEEHGAKDAAWYDAAFERQVLSRRHYTESPYYFLWTVVADRLVGGGHRAVLEIGCGAGQLAGLLHDKGIAGYCGLDWSPKRIAQARRVCPEFEFVVADAEHTDLFQSRDYDAVVTTEFLEHVEADLEILGRIRSGVRVLGTVPNFPFVSHVRHFKDVDSVEERYAPSFRRLRVDTFFGNASGKTFFLLDGVRD